jgi:molecular chaperone GrpE
MTNKDEELEHSEENVVQPAEELGDGVSENPTQETGPEAAEESAIDATDALRLEVEAWKDKYMRLHAEFDNFRKRNAKERLDLIRNASSDVILEILPVMDDFERAVKANESIDDIVQVKEGFKIIQQKLVKKMEQRGLTSMNSVGQPFDTDHHEAITQIPAPSKKLKGKVVDEVEKGYFLNETVLRYAKVVVGQ